MCQLWLLVPSRVALSDMCWRRSDLARVWCVAAVAIVPILGLFLLLLLLFLFYVLVLPIRVLCKLIGMDLDFTLNGVCFNCSPEPHTPLRYDDARSNAALLPRELASRHRSDPRLFARNLGPTPQLCTQSVQWSAASLTLTLVLLAADCDSGQGHHFHAAADPVRPFSLLETNSAFCHRLQV